MMNKTIRTIDHLAKTHEGVCHSCLDCISGKQSRDCWGHWNHHDLKELRDRHDSAVQLFCGNNNSVHAAVDIALKHPVQYAFLLLISFALYAYGYMHDIMLYVLSSVFALVQASVLRVPGCTLSAAQGADLYSSHNTAYSEHSVLPYGLCNIVSDSPVSLLYAALHRLYLVCLYTPYFFDNTLCDSQVYAPYAFHNFAFVAQVLFLYLAHKDASYWLSHIPYILFAIYLSWFYLWRKTQGLLDKSSGICRIVFEGYHSRSKPPLFSHLISCVARMVRCSISSSGVITPALGNFLNCTFFSPLIKAEV